MPSFDRRHCADSFNGIAIHQATKVKLDCARRGRTGFNGPASKAGSSLHEPQRCSSRPLPESAGPPIWQGISQAAVRSLPRPPFMRSMSCGGMSQAPPCNSELPAAVWHLHLRQPPALPPSHIIKAAPQDSYKDRPYKAANDMPLILRCLLRRIW